MAPKQKQGEFYIGDGSHLTIKTSAIVEMHDHLKLMIGVKIYPYKIDEYNLRSNQIYLRSLGHTLSHH